MVYATTVVKFIAQMVEKARKVTRGWQKTVCIRTRRLERHPHGASLPLFSRMVVISSQEALWRLFSHRGTGFSPLRVPISIQNHLQQ